MTGLVAANLVVWGLALWIWGRVLHSYLRPRAHTKDLGSAIVEGDVVYKRLGLLPWPGVVTRTDEDHAWVEWWGVWWSSEYPLATLTTRRPWFLVLLACCGAAYAVLA